MSILTTKQLSANRRNSKFGGVKTDEGKAISRLNAVKHNVLGNILSMEEAKDALVIQTRFTKEFKPASTIEEVLIERMTLWYVRLLRATKAETEEIRKIHNPTVTKTTNSFDFDFGTTTEVVHVGYEPKMKKEDIESLEKTYLRYESLIERNFYKALHELQRVQATRRGDPIPSSMALDINLADDK